MRGDFYHELSYYLDDWINILKVINKICSWQNLHKVFVKASKRH